MPDKPADDAKSEDLKKAEEAAAIAKALKEKAEYDKQAAEAQKAVLLAEHEREKLQATREMGLAQAQADIMAKLLPKGEAKPLEGKVDIKDVGPAARLVAYHAVKVMASEIAEVLGNELTEQDKVMIVPQLDFATGDLPLVELMEQFNLFERLLAARLKENKEILQEPPPPVKAAAVASVAAMSAGPALLAMAGTIIPGLANLVGYFKTDHTITGYEFDLDKEGLFIRVAGAVSQKGKKIYLYNFYTLGDLEALPIVQKFAELSNLSQDLESSKVRLAAKKAGTQPGGDTTKIDGALKDTQTLLDTVKTYAQAITSKAAGEDYPRLVRASLRDRVRQMGITHLLYLNVLPKSAGETITKKNIWRTTKTVGYLGGAAVSYVLAKTDGRVVLGDTLIRLSVFNYRLEEPVVSDLKSIPFDEGLKRSVPPSSHHKKASTRST